MKNNIRIFLMLMASLVGVNAQNFTNNVNADVDHAVFNYNNGNNSEHSAVSSPIYFTMKFASFDGKVSAELNHDGKSYQVFDNSTLNNSSVIVGPIDKFFGTHQSGNWQLKIETTKSIFIENWGVFTIPEASSISIFGLGSVVFLGFKRKLLTL